MQTVPNPDFAIVHFVALSILMFNFLCLGVFVCLCFRNVPEGSDVLPGYGGEANCSFSPP